MRSRSTKCRGVAVAAAAFLAAGCTDAATRVAYDIESGAARLGSGDGARREISHTPRSWPSGCSAAYTLIIRRGAAESLGNDNYRMREGSGGLSVRCWGADGNPVGYGTTYHLRFVDVPETVEVTKQGGEPAVIDVERRSGRAVVTGVR